MLIFHWREYLFILFLCYKTTNHIVHTTQQDISGQIYMHESKFEALSENKGLTMFFQLLIFLYKKLFQTPI